MRAQHTIRYWARQALRNALPAGSFERLDRARRWRKFRRAGVVFVHVPKAAGSSIATAIYGGRLGHHPAHALMGESPSSWTTLEKFAVVREPMARFLSAYVYALSAGTGQGAIRWRADYGNPAYRDVNAFVREYLVHGDIFEKDLVFWPQSHFVRDPAGGAVPGLRLFTTGQISRVDAFLAALGHAAPARINRRRGDAGLGLTVDPETRRLLESVYRADFEWFGGVEAGE